MTPDPAYTPDQLARVIDGLRTRKDPIAPAVVLRIVEAYKRQSVALQAEVAELQRALAVARRGPPAPVVEPSRAPDEAPSEEPAPKARKGATAARA